MNEKQKENLKSLLKLPELASKIDTEFNMKTFFNVEENGLFNSDSASIEASDYVCGTSACLAGHLPLTTGIPKKDDEDWNGYIERVVGIHLRHEWEYLFSENWSDSLDDAMERVKTFIANGFESPDYYNFNDDY